MSLSKGIQLTYALKSSVVEPIWIVQLYYDSAGASDFIGISDKDRIVGGVQYYGVVTNFGEIHSKIDLAKSQAATSTMQMELVNEWKTGAFSKILFGGTNKYLNRKVRIYFHVIEDSTLANWMELYQGELTGISHDQTSIYLTIDAKKPGEGITIPQTKSPNGNYQPIAYGDFVQDSETNFFTSKAMFPVPFEKREQNKLYFTVHKALTGDAELYFYDRNLDRFIEITSAGANSESSGSVNIANVPIDMQREVRLRPTSVDTSNNDFEDPENAYDEDPDGSSDETTFARYPASGYHAVTATGSDVTEQYSLVLYFPEPVGKFSDLDVRVEAEVEVDWDGSTFDDGSSWIKLINNIYSLDKDLISVFGSELGGADRTETRSDTTEDSISDLYDPATGSCYVDEGYQLPSSIELIAEWEAKNVGGTQETINGQVSVFDVYLQGTIKLDFDNEAEAAEKFIEDLKHLYCGADGLDKSYSGGSGTAELPHEIHRDLLARFTDFDYADGSMIGFTDLTTARTAAGDSTQDWDCRWWCLEEKSLEDVLQQIQFEGCFIFLPRYHTAGGKFVFVKDSYSSGDVKETLNEDDYEDINISFTPLWEQVTDANYNYQRHPAKNQYIQSVNYTNSTAKADWYLNSANKENTKTFNLDFIASDSVYTSGTHSSPNDCVALYYDNILAVPKILVSCTIKNMDYYYLEVGDIIQFNDSDVDPFNKTWSDLYFMVVETRRSIDSLEILAREVYEA